MEYYGNPFIPFWQKNRRSFVSSYIKTQYNHCLVWHIINKVTVNILKVTRSLAFMNDSFRESIKQKQRSRGVLRKRCSENMQQIYRRTPMPMCDFDCNFIEIALWYGCSPVNLLHIFRIPFPKNSSGWLLLIRAAELKIIF